jgi:hypothetical protein
MSIEPASRTPNELRRSGMCETGALERDPAPAVSESSIYL